MFGYGSLFKAKDLGRRKCLKPEKNIGKRKKMKINEYLVECSRTCRDLGNKFSNQLHMVIGASTETGELLDIYKKILAYGKELDIVNISEEIFDCFWYLVNLCRMLNIDIEQGLQTNIDKLRTRYPEKFTKYDAINRDLKKERDVLERSTGGIVTGLAQLSFIDDKIPVSWDSDKLGWYPKEGSN